MDTTHDSACYRLQVNGHTLVADGASKGEPGDTVVIWPVKGGPRVARLLARCAARKGVQGRGGGAISL